MDTTKLAGQSSEMSDEELKLLEKEIDKDLTDNPVSEEQMARGHERLMAAITGETATPVRGVTISHERYAMLERMESCAQAMAERVVELFKEKRAEARKDLILKAAEVLKINPPPHLQSVGEIRSGNLAPNCLKPL